MLTKRTWRPDTVILFIGLQIFCAFLGGMAVVLLDKYGVAAFKLPDGFGVVVVGTLSFQGATLALIGLFLWQNDTEWREFFGLRDPRLAPALGWGILTAVVLLPVLWGMQNASLFVLEKLHYPQTEETAVQLVEATKTFWSRIYMIGFTAVLAPIAEEFIFRGLFFPFVKQLGYPKLAWFGVSALFALIHLDVATFLPLVALALALTWLYEKTGNLLAPIAAHALFNAVNLVVLLWPANPPSS